MTSSETVRLQELAKQCRAQAATAAHQGSRAALIQMAQEYEQMATSTAPRRRNWIT